MRDCWRSVDSKECIALRTIVGPSPQSSPRSRGEADKSRRCRTNAKQIPARCAVRVRGADNVHGRSATPTTCLPK